MTTEHRMATATLVVSNPPHDRPDPQVVAPAFGLSAAEVVMKAYYPIPEIWFADSDEGKAAESAESLKRAGFSVELLNGQEVADVPRQEVVKSFSFT